MSTTLTLERIAEIEAEFLGAVDAPDLDEDEQDLAQNVAALCDLARQALEGQWLPIETAPKDGTIIDLWMDDRIADHQFREPDAWWLNGAWVTVNDDFLVFPLPHEFTPTHWRPLPTPPTQQKA